MGVFFDWTVDTIDTVDTGGNPHGHRAKSELQRILKKRRPPLKPKRARKPAAPTIKYGFAAPFLPQAGSKSTRPKQLPAELPPFEGLPTFPMRDLKTFLKEKGMDVDALEKSARERADAEAVARAQMRARARAEARAEAAARAQAEATGRANKQALIIYEQWKPYLQGYLDTVSGRTGTDFEDALSQWLNVRIAGVYKNHWLPRDPIYIPEESLSPEQKWVYGIAKKRLQDRASRYPAAYKTFETVVGPQISAGSIDIELAEHLWDLEH